VDKALGAERSQKLERRRARQDFLARDDRSVCLARLEDRLELGDDLLGRLCVAA